MKLFNPALASFLLITLTAGSIAYSQALESSGDILAAKLFRHLQTLKGPIEDSDFEAGHQNLGRMVPRRHLRSEVNFALSTIVLEWGPGRLASFSTEVAVDLLSRVPYKTQMELLNRWHDFDTNRLVNDVRMKQGSVGAAAVLTTSGNTERLGEIIFAAAIKRMEARHDRMPNHEFDAVHDKFLDIEERAKELDIREKGYRLLDRETQEKKASDTDLFLHRLKSTESLSEVLEQIEERFPGTGEDWEWPTRNRKYDRFVRKNLRQILNLQNPEHMLKLLVRADLELPHYDGIVRYGGINRKTVFLTQDKAAALLAARVQRGLYAIREHAGNVASGRHVLYGGIKGTTFAALAVTSRMYSQPELMGSWGELYIPAAAAGTLGFLHELFEVWTNSRRSSSGQEFIANSNNLLASYEAQSRFYEYLAILDPEAEKEIRKHLQEHAEDTGLVSRVQNRSGVSGCAGFF